MISRTNRVGNWGNRRGFPPVRKRKVDASGNLWCKNCKDYHEPSVFSPQGDFYQQSCRISRNESLRKSRMREIVCAHCKAPFISRNRIQKYCSCRCKSKAVDIKNSARVSICQNCNQEFRSPERHRQKYCSKACAFIGRRRDPNKALARGKRGPDWPKQSSAARVRDGNVCVICERPDRKNITVDHIIPYRLAIQWSPEPNDLVNLACMCGSCHGTKTGIEAALLKGDIVGFVMGMRCRVGLEDSRLFAAMNFFGLPYYRRTL